MPTPDKPFTFLHPENIRPESLATLLEAISAVYATFSVTARAENLKHLGSNEEARNYIIKRAHEECQTLIVAASFVYEEANRLHTNNRHDPTALERLN